MAADDTRNLIHGLLVQRLGFVTSAAALGAIEAWRGDMSRPLLEVFVERGLVSPASRAVVETVADQLVKTHGGEAAALTALVGVGVLPDDERTKSLPGGSLQGSRYEILDELAHGGMGQVLRASDAVLGREVLVKQMLGEIAHDPPAQASFARERQTAAALEHPNIGPVYDAGVHGDGRLYYVMRYIRGDTLKQAIQRHHDAASDRSPAEKTLALRDLLGRFSAVCEAVSYAHARGVLHRDIKPANILLGDFGETQLIDWGLAKVGGEEIATAAGSESGSGSRPVVAVESGTSEPTRMGQAKGTPAFMAPEQAAGEIARIGPAADVYGLGSTLYQILTGVPPFDGRSPSVMQDVIRGVFPRPRRVAPGVPPALEAICLKAMAREPADRYPSAKALATDIGRWLADEPVGVYRDPWTVRVARFAKRHRTAVTAAGVLLATGLVALGVGNVLIRQQRDIAQANATVARQVIDTLGKEIGDDAWAVIPNAELNRLNVMHESNRQYEALLRVEPQNDALRLEAVDGYRREGNLARLVVRYGEAARLYARAHELVTGVLAATPDNPRAIGERFNLLADRCVLRHFQADPAAGDGYRGALAAAAAIQRQFPEVNVTGVVSRIKADYGGWQVDDGRPAEGLAMLREAVDGLVVTGPSMQDGIDHTQMMLVATLCALSRAEAESGDLPAAIATADRAIAAADAGLASAKVANHPDVVQMKAAALLQRAILAARAPDLLDDAIAQATAAVEIYGALAARNKKIAGHHHHLAEAVITRGEMLYTAGRRDEARKDAAAALTAVDAAERCGSGEQADVVRMVNLDAARAWLLRARLLTDANDAANAKPTLQQARERIDKELKGFPRCPESLRVKEGIETLGRQSGHAVER
ncbi:MAG: serine/threonine protein kinase [Planctomycetes bacterium]|nr:serine/threonine protein kinase [Planctomycetota bacterium]